MKKHFLHLIPGILAASLFFTVCGLNAAAEAPAVYFTSDISAEGMMAVYEALGWKPDGDGASLVERIESRNGLHTLEHAEEIGLGSRTYDLVNIDE